MWRLWSGWLLLLLTTALSPGSLQILEGELGLYATCVLPITGTHVSTVLVYHMCLEVESRVEDNELSRLTLALTAGEVDIREVLFLEGG